MFTDSLAPWELSALKVAAGALIQRLGGFDAAEVIAGRGRAQLHAYKDIHHSAFMPVDVLLRLERAWVEAGGQPILAPLLARQLGHVMLPIAKGEGELSREMAGLVRESAAAAAQHIEAMSDGSLSDAERAELAEAVHRLHAVTGRVLALLAGPRLPLRAVAGGRDAA